MTTAFKLRQGIRKVKGDRGPGGRPVAHGARALLERAKDGLLDRRFTIARRIEDRLAEFAADLGGLEEIGASTRATLRIAAFQDVSIELWQAAEAEAMAKNRKPSDRPKWLPTAEAALPRNLNAAVELEKARRSMKRDGVVDLASYLAGRTATASDDVPQGLKDEPAPDVASAASDTDHADVADTDAEADTEHDA